MPGLNAPDGDKKKHKQRMDFRDYSAESALFIRRAVVAFIGIVILSAVLVVNLYHLQINRHEDYQTRSNDNRIKLVPIPPSRGLIYDRKGTLLAENRTIYQLEIVPEKVTDLPDVLNELREIVDLTDEDIANYEKRAPPFAPLYLYSAENPAQPDSGGAVFGKSVPLPGLEIKGYQRRFYPYGSALTHVIGYVAKINDKDVERLDKDGLLPNYAATHDIGKLGIERYYESVLHGKTGYEEVEVNSRGRVIRQLHEQAPQAGKISI